MHDTPYGTFKTSMTESILQVDLDRVVAQQPSSETEKSGDEVPEDGGSADRESVGNFGDGVCSIYMRLACLILAGVILGGRPPWRPRARAVICHWYFGLLVSGRMRVLI